MKIDSLSEINFDNIIKASHERCRNMNINTHMESVAEILHGKKLDSVLSESRSLIEIAMPFINLLYEFLKGSGFMIHLTDKHGYILTVTGDEEVIEYAANMGMVVGTDMSEKSCGTNAIGTALYENCPIQLAERQHFIDIYHVWTCSSCPIYDLNGNGIGCINLTGFHHFVHPHTLGLVVAASNAIENQLRTEQAQNEVFEIYQYCNTIINSIDYGVLSINEYNKIKSVNNKALDIFGMNMNNMIGTNTENLIDNWKEILLSLQKEGEYSDEEFISIKNNKRKRFHLTAYPIKDPIQNLFGIVVMLKDIQNVYNLVSKYSGKNAYYTFDDIIGKSSTIREVVEYSKVISNTPSTVLIQGESGTGKEIFAQSIHNNSDRRNHPFIDVNCGSIPKNLIESELFGYEEGAFTGARKGGMPGKFELANNGTIFLDEIGEMPMDMQVNLLRVLEERYITRVGGTRKIPINVRVVAATNKNLLEEIHKGNFRMDLYYRLNVIPIYLPPLRKRREDIKILIDHFLKKKAERLGMNIPKISKDDYEVLINYDWPGNIRELENRMENLVLHGKLPIDFYKQKSKASDALSIPSQFEYNMHSLAEWERIAIKECLKKCNGNISKASKILQVDRSTIYKKIKKYRIF
ncbi:sigma 54-interacting transcriptional regulator [Clostridiaceae bacterium 35-E11]